ncbi:MAG: hypothetical protein OJF51_000763 [Nitrospira sp.]|jgi:hypothetical protein|nr:MAG: hypothetical protein OJF51_000763 [Nitrospira sp.]
MIFKITGRYRSSIGLDSDDECDHGDSDDVLSYADYPIARAVSFHAVRARLIPRSSPLLRLISPIRFLPGREKCLAERSGASYFYFTKEFL